MSDRQPCVCGGYGPNHTPSCQYAVDYPEPETFAEGLGADEGRPSMLAPGQEAYVDPPVRLTMDDYSPLEVHVARMLSSSPSPWWALALARRIVNAIAEWDPA